MEVSVSGPDSLAVEAQVFALAVRDGTAPPGDLGERVRSLLDGDGFEAKPGDAVLLHLPAEAGAERVAVGGLGAEIDADAVRTAAGGIARLVEPIGGTVAWILDDSSAADGDGAGSRGRRRADPGRVRPGAPKDRGAEGRGAQTCLRRRRRCGSGGARRRRRALGEPRAGSRERTAERADPAGLAEHAERIASESGGRLQAESFGRERMTELGMGSFLAVSQGSAQEPRTIVLRYDPPDADGDATLGLVGKAVTFDTGGISIKPALYMEDMKGDMSGGAAVLAGLGAIAELGLPVRAIGVVGATENMVGGGAYRPGDIVRAMNGTTIEIVNTDAEGDSSSPTSSGTRVSRSHAPRRLRDADRRHGKALGDLYAGVFGNDDEWRDRVVDAGNRSGDLAWGLPIHRRFHRYTDSAFADLKNSSVRGQAIPAYAAGFLQSSSARARGPTSTWPGRPFCAGRGRTTSTSSAAPGTACG